MTVQEFDPDAEGVIAKETIGDSDPDDAVDEPDDSVEAEPLHTEEDNATFTVDYPGAGGEPAQ